MLLSLSVSDGYSYATEKSERDEALLSVVEPIILKRQGCSFEHPGCVQKIKAMHLEVDPTLPFVVGNAHRHSVYTGVRWVKKGLACCSSHPPLARRMAGGLGSGQTHAVQLFSRVVDEIRRDKRCLRVEDGVVTLRVQQHLVQTPEHAVRL